MVVLDDADLARVVAGGQDRRLLELRPGLHGVARASSSASRVYDDVLERDQGRDRGDEVADPADGDDVDMGPVISAEQRERVLGFLERLPSRATDRDRRRGGWATAASS